MKHWLTAGLVLLLTPSSPAWAAANLSADRTFWLVGSLLLFALALGVQFSCYLEHRQRRRALSRRRARPRR